MNIWRSCLATLSALPFAILIACAEPAPPPGTTSVTMEQFVARQTARIMAADTDGDGRVSRAEMAKFASAGASRGGHDPSRLFDVMDTNHDGHLYKDEIRTALERRFHRMDSNGDGILAPDERMAARALHRQGSSPSTPPATQPEQ